MILKLLLIVLISPFFKPGDDPQTFRKMYTEAVFKQEKAEAMLGMLSARPKTPLVTGYLGAVNMIMAKHVFNPMRKLSLFKTGTTYMDQSINEKPADAELRLLRYTIQVSAPSFLGYNSKIRTDKTFLLNSLRSGTVKDEELVRMIAGFLNQQENTPAEKQLLKKYL